MKMALEELFYSNKVNLHLSGHLHRYFILLSKVDCWSFVACFAARLRLKFSNHVIVTRGIYVNGGITRTFTNAQSWFHKRKCHNKNRLVCFCGNFYLKLKILNQVIFSYERTCPVVAGDCVSSGHGTVYVIVGAAGKFLDSQYYNHYPW